MSPKAASEVPLAQVNAAVPYHRGRDLPRLLKLWPEEVRRLAEADQPWLVERLGQVLRAERQRGLTRHWSYDLSSHAALLRAYRAENEALDLQMKLTVGAAAMFAKPAAPAARPAASRSRGRLSLPATAQRGL